MSMLRTVARLAVVHALNNYLKEPWPTLAGRNIFDSKIEPIEDMAADRAFPCVVVYTDYDKDHWTKGSMSHKDRLLSVTMELLVVQMEQDKKKPNTYRAGCPLTDSEIEQDLDDLESQILWALNAGSLASDAFNAICPNLNTTISRRGASVEGGQRLAARQITTEMKASREPLMGTLMKPVEAFLAELEKHADYGPRVAMIRQGLTRGAGATAYEREMRNFGYSRQVMDALGMPANPTIVLPPAIDFTLLSGGEP
ncbi:hypothetical protein J2X65_003496 [Ancylobacter sp. 3268]|uniref:hypothetical protein n=1 Tax=Ancylobacter sp. 3268 TaxID=2817752 RepID=UPI002858F9FE|nr:hypothetical protein [Ancylobacter sp. 3268]MDR6954128.1 hypothetical protein [Ancylobacter sp. 3268]